MSGSHLLGHRAAPRTSAVARALGFGAFVGSILTALVVAGMSVAASDSQASPAPRTVGALPRAAATASPSSDGPVTEPRDATAQPAATASASTTGSPSTGGKNLAKTGSPSGSVLLGSLLALGVGVAFLVLGRGLPVGRHQRGGRPLHSAVS